MKIKKYIILIAMAALMQNIINAKDESTLKDKLLSVLCFPMASSNGSNEIKKEVELLSKTINPKAKVTVKDTNGLGRFLFGFKNVMAIPFLNILLINDRWLKTLSKEAQKFVIARSLTYMLSHPYECSVYKYIFPWIMHSFFGSTRHWIYNFTTLHQSQNKTQISAIIALSTVLHRLLTPYILRRIEYRIDAQAAVEFDCLDGAIAALSDITKFSTNGTIIDRSNAIISPVECAEIASKILDLYHSYNNDDENSNLHKIITAIDLMPGHFNTRISLIGSAPKNLPILNLLSGFPMASKRMKMMITLRNKIRGERIKQEAKEKQSQSTKAPDSVDSSLDKP